MPSFAVYMGRYERVTMYCPGLTKKGPLPAPCTRGKKEHVRPAFRDSCAEHGSQAAAAFSCVLFATAFFKPCGTQG